MAEEKSRSFVHIGITGPEYFTDYTAFSEQLERYIIRKHFHINEITRHYICFFTGNAPGTEAMVQRYAFEHGICCTVFPLEPSREGPAEAKKRQVVAIGVMSTHFLVFVRKGGYGKTNPRAREEYLNVNYYAAVAKRLSTPISAAPVEDVPAEYQ